MTLQPAYGTRTVIDNNVIIPPLPYQHPETNWLVILWQSGRIKPLVNDETLAELETHIFEKKSNPQTASKRGVL